MRIRDAVPQDVPEIARLERECFTTPWTEEIIRSQLSGEGKLMLAAEEDGRFAGYMGLQYVLDEGYIKNFQVVEDGKQGIIRVTLKYAAGKQKVIHGLRRVSKPGLRIYSNCEDMPKVMNGLGIAIVSTSKGVMTDKKARQANVGGEVLAFVW